MSKSNIEKQLANGMTSKNGTFNRIPLNGTITSSLSYNKTKKNTVDLTEKKFFETPNLSFNLDTLILTI